MAALLVCMIACLLAGIGGRTQYLAAALAERFGSLAALGLAAMLAAFPAAALAAWAGERLSESMNGDARLMLVGLALLLAGGAMLFPVRKPKLGSGRLGALATALLLFLPQCLMDAGAFIVMAATAYWGFPMLAAAGGGVGMFASIFAGLMLAGSLHSLPLRRIAFGVGGLLAVIGAGLMLSVI